jgi:hypothetical protein
MKLNKCLYRLILAAFGMSNHLPLQGAWELELASLFWSGIQGYANKHSGRA